MAYKFQRGVARLSGSVIAEDGLQAENSGLSSAGAISGATTISGSGVISGLSLDIEKGADLNGGGITNAGAITGATNISGSGNLEVGGQITGSAILLIDASGLAGTALEDDTTGKLKISDGGVTNAMLAGSIANGKLANSQVTVTAGDGLQGGGTMALGGSVTLNVDVDVMAGVGLTADNTNEELDVSAQQTGITSIMNNSLKIGYGTSDAHIDFATDNNIIFDIDDTEKFRVDAAGVDVAGIISGSGNLLVGGQITGSAILLIDASGLAGTALEDDTTGKLKISDGGVTNAMLAGSIANAKLSNSAITIAGTATSLGGEITAATIASAIDSETMSLTAVADLDGAQGNLTIFNTLNAERTLTIGASNGTVAIAGDLTVNGTTTTVNSTTVEIADKNIVLASGGGNDSAANGGGITVSSSAGDKTFQYSAANESFQANQHLDVASGKSYLINGSNVLSSDTLGSDIVNSSLTSLGTITSLVATTADINGGTADNVVIGGSTAAAGTFTTLDCNDGAFSIANLDIDGATDIGEDLVDADLLIVDNGAGGTNRKVAMSRIKSYIGSAGLTPNARVDGNSIVIDELTYVADRDGSAQNVTLTMPASAAALVGRSVYIKAGNLENNAKITINTAASSQKIDGEDSIVLESPFASVRLIYVATDDWRVF